MPDIVYSIINFLILAVGLYFLGRGFVAKLFNERRDEIKKNLNDSAAALERASELDKNLDALAAEHNSRMEDIRKASGERAEKETQRLLDKVSRAKLDIIENEKLDEEELENLMLKGLQTSYYDRLFDAAATLLGSEAYEEKRKALIYAFPDKLSSALNEFYSEHRVDADDNGIKAELRYADVLPDDVKSEIINCVSDFFKRKNVSIELSRDEKLIGGGAMVIGDTFFDYSYFGALRELKRDLFEKQAPVANIVEHIKAELSVSHDIMNVYQLGRVLSVSDGICRVSGLSEAMEGELLEFKKGLNGIVMDLDAEGISVIMLGSCSDIAEGDTVRCTGKIVEVPVGSAMIGRVVDALGRPIDNRGEINTAYSRAIESPAPAVIDRQAVNVPMLTGIKAIDALVPIGRGQRELIIGDRQTGKTAIAVDAILNQKGKNMLCVYVAIGQKESTVAQVVDKLRKHGAMEYTCVVCANASDSAPMLYIAPYAGTAIAEYFMYNGRDVLIIYDDLSKHAVAYREISLLLHRPPGREAYPGDVFYLHSRLLERSARLSEALGGGSITALPIVETQSGDISAYIPTNVISITDGQIFLEEDLFNSGVRPAINAGLSVSRVGGAAQPKAMKQVSGHLRTSIAQYRELQSFSQFGSDLDKATLDSLNRGDRLVEVLKQGQYTPLSVAEQVIQLYATDHGFFDEIALKDVSTCQTELAEYFTSRNPELAELINSGAKLNDSDFSSLSNIIDAFMYERSKANNRRAAIS